MSSADDDCILASAAFIVIHSLLKKQKLKKVKKQRRYWVSPHLESRNRRPTLINFNNIKIENKLRIDYFCRISASDFEDLISMIGSKIRKQDTSFRDAIPVKDRLAVTLRFLSTGDSFTTIAYMFKISKQSISVMIPEVCRAMIDALQEYVKTPNSSEEWLDITSDNEEKWKFPHCLGIIDGKQINDRQVIDLILMTIVDANYNFIFAKIKHQDMDSNEDAIRKLQDIFDTITLENLPNDTQTSLPYVFIANESYSLENQYIIKPFKGTYPEDSKQEIFNRRLSEMYQINENIFGHMSMVFKALKPTVLESSKIQLIVLTCIHLHNFLSISESSQNLYSPKGAYDYVDENEKEIQGNWRRDEIDLNLINFFLRLPQTNVESSVIDDDDIRKEFLCWDHHTNVNI